MIETYIGKTIEVHSKLCGFLIAKGPVIDTAGSNMLYVDIGSDEEIAVTIGDDVDIKIVE